MIAPLIAAAVIQVSSPSWYCARGPIVDGLPTLHCLMPPRPIAEAVMTRPIFEPVDTREYLDRPAILPPMGRTRFRPKREPTE